MKPGRCWNLLASLWAALLLPASGCLPGAARPSAPVASGPVAPAAGVRFRNVAAERGVRFPLSGGPLEEMTIVDVSAGGAGLLDYDGDGDLDVLLLGLSRLGLFRNDGRGFFTEVPDCGGLEAGQPWMGCAAGDVDNDGKVDLLLTGFRCLRLYRNTGRGFQDLTARSGLVGDRWNTSAAFADFDGDGDLDLYVGAYVQFGPGSRQHCPAGVGPGGEVVSGPCGPEPYPAALGRLYENDGRGVFRDVTRSAGLHRASGKTLGVAVADYDGDGRPDLYLANDRMPGDLFRNAGKLRFSSVGMLSGTAYNREGKLQGGMGVDWGDADGDGDPDLLVATYQGEPKSLYRNDGRGSFQEVSRVSGLAPADPYVAFGARFFDADNDGRLDLFLANGHALGPLEQVDKSLTYAQPMQLFLNTGSGGFAERSSSAGEAFARPVVGRGVALGDIDNDGRCDLLVGNIEGEPVLLRNETEPAGAWLRVRLAGSRSNRAGLGARVTVRAGGQSQTREVTTSSSYLSTSDPRLHFGLGGAGEVDEVVVRWPSGQVSRVRAAAVNREITVREGVREGDGQR